VQSAAILAGGQATRFDGRDKGSLIVDGRTILERQIAELSRVTGDVLIVERSGLDRAGFRFSTARRAEARRAEAAVPVAGAVVPRLISDIVPGCGPLGGVHAALTEARGDALFVAACDMPYLDAGFIRYLLGLTADADAVVPRTERGYHPLCAVYTRACLHPIARRLADRRLKMIDLLNDVRTRIVTPEELNRFSGDGKLLANVNTPAEYAGLEAGRDHEL
jgi:molybdopterin-guanine dinucleotide biosynthesis protein A